MITGITAPTITAVELEEEESTMPELFSVPVNWKNIAIYTTCLMLQYLLKTIYVYTSHKIGNDVN